MEVNFEELSNRIATGDLVFVDFWAEWCGPCKVMGPVVDSLAEANPNTNILKIEVDKEPDAAAEYRVRAIPTFIIFKDGKEVDRFSGVQDMKQIQTKLDEYDK